MYGRITGGHVNDTSPTRHRHVTDTYRTRTGHVSDTYRTLYGRITGGLLSSKGSYLRLLAEETNREVRESWLPEWAVRRRAGEPLTINVVMLGFATLCPGLVEAIVALNISNAGGGGI